MKRLFRDHTGSPAIEFALAFPVVIGLSMGVVEVGYIAFAESTLAGAVREASRAGVTNFSPQGMSREEFVLGQITDRMTRFPHTNIDIETVVYDSFSDVGRPEPFIDEAPFNGVFDDGECFSDVNQNGQWDADMGQAGLGGSGGVVVYRASVDLELLTPVFRLFTGNETGTMTLSAATAVRNEPFSFVNQNLGGEADTICGN